MNILHTLDTIVFSLMALAVSYIFVFALFSLWDRKNDHKQAKKKSRVVVLIPAYKEDSVIIESVDSMLKQDYEADCLDVVVISDKMQDETNQQLLKLPITLFIINPEISSKAHAMNCAIDLLGERNYDFVVILDADNTVEENFISRINDIYNSGIKAIQAHRKAKNFDNDMAILDAISEEINNSIFRKGHTSFGLSSALIGSGMAFDYEWFRMNVKKLETAGEDKELELLLFKERIYIDFIDDLPVYDEKVKKKRVFYNQRRRWLATQVGSFISGLKGVPKAIFSLNLDYIDKIVQWLLPPRVVMIGFISIVSLLLLVIDWKISLKWIVLLIFLVVTFVMAIPDYLVTKRNLRAVKRIPLLFILMFINLFRTKGANKKFIHTQKG